MKKYSANSSNFCVTVEKYINSI